MTRRVRGTALSLPIFTVAGSLGAHETDTPLALESRREIYDFLARYLD